MKTITNTLKLRIDRWSDPGDYPSGAGGSPLPSRDFVEGVDGQIVVELSREDWTGINDHMDMDVTTERAITSYLADNPGEVKHGIPELAVQTWCIDGLAGDRLTLCVDEFEARTYDPPEREYDPCDAYDREERRLGLP